MVNAEPDEDEQSQNSRGSGASGSMASDISNNSRAHMYNVTQICFVKKQSGKFTDNYEIKEQLGEGSYGKVCRCVSKISRLERAAKFIKKKSIDDPKGVQRF